MRTILLVLSLFFLFTGCTQQSGPQTKTKSAAEDPQCIPTPVRHFDSEQKAKAIAERVGGIDRAVAVQIDNELDVAIQVSNFNRLRLESIRKDVAKKLKSAFPKTNIHVTSDKKLIDELQKLSETPWSTKKEEACKQKKKIKKIEQQMKG
ncbi:sporulation protein [Brevibacillus sp. SYP-B805]|uniref:YhcN/YlaJ family sporulation lipoprotein n=1 Tax=Brevibacillus sp. SYP-B805 TaxID=1578199 RepID=UPI0013EA55E3|nr:YhcN/YlaJ family sporulation lipoprotein [Brevibacillus sp. SYP-B805]NGQ93982.1 sporulation protein [Brevibacillus sp. SYP-B805]